jgi:metallo-beta-lactamase class B
MRFDALILGLLIGATGPVALAAQTGRDWTPDEILSRTVNPSREHQLAPWPAHRIIDNIYYVGTRNLGAFLVTTSEGHILINTTFEETLPLVRDSIEDLGFRIEDIRIILGSHAHPDHMSGNQALKEWTGARIMVMAEDIPLLEQLGPGGGSPVDRILHHQDTVTLGGATLTALLTPGHTPGTTTWTLEATEGGSSYGVVILGGGVSPRARLAGNPEVQDQFRRTFEINRSLDCDVPLGPHAPMYRMEEKHARLGEGSNPFIDPAVCDEEMWLQEQAFDLRLEEQTRQLRN